MKPFLDRKPMRLQRYNYEEENMVFVTVCVDQRKKILGTVVPAGPEGAETFVALSDVGKTVETFTKTIPGIDKYVIMPNHVHMLVFVPEGKHISNIIRSWKTLITKQIGKSIWQRDYYDHVIRDEQDYQVRWQYIENNPVKWTLDPYYQK